MQTIIFKQRDFFTTHKTKSLTFRRKQLKKLETAIRANESELLEAVYKDVQKSAFESQATELALVYRDIQDAYNNLHHWSAKKSTKTNLLNVPAKSYVIPEPLGVSLIIGAWNYPYLMSLGPLVAAMAAGCTAVVKPSELPAHASAALKKMIAATFAEEYIAVIEGGISETTELLTHKFDKIFFTGSGRVGKVVYKAAAEHLTPVTLELGGKSPAIVTADCDLKMTVKRLIWGKFLNAGQTCIAPDYVLVDKRIEKKFLEACKVQIKAQQYDVTNGNYAQIINSSNLERLEALMPADKVFCGGVVHTEQRTISPTILSGITFEDEIMNEEIFGPILPVIAYENFKEAMSHVATLPKPLACYLFTKNSKTKKKLLRELPFGGGMVNDTVMQITNTNMPFGGVGSSGIGSYHGENGFRAFTHYKSIIEKSNLFELPLKYFPLSKSKLWWIKQFFKW